MSQTEQKTQLSELMTKEELLAIGTKLYGKWGWPVKIGLLVGKDSSTIRRWKLGTSAIDPAAALQIREHFEKFKNDVSWAEQLAPDLTPEVRVLRLISKLKRSPGSKITFGLNEDSRITIELRRPGKAILIAVQSGDEYEFDGLGDLEQALD